MANLSIDFSSPEVIKFVETLEKSLKSDISVNEYNYIWDSLRDDPVYSTVYICLFLGAVHLIDTEKDFGNLSQVVAKLKLGSHTDQLQVSMAPKLSKRSFSELKTNSPRSERTCLMKYEDVIFKEAAVMEVNIRTLLLHSCLYAASFTRFDNKNPNLLFLIDKFEASDPLSLELRTVLLQGEDGLLTRCARNWSEIKLPTEYDLELAPPTNNADPLSLLGGYLYEQIERSYRRTNQNTAYGDDSEIVRYVLREVKRGPKFLAGILPLLSTPHTPLNADTTKWWAELEMLTDALKPCLLLPLPFGQLGRQLLETVHNELTCPGLALRNKLSRALAFETLQSGEIIQTRRIVYVLFNPIATYSDNFNMFNLVEQNVNATHHAKANLLLNLLEVVQNECETNFDVFNLPANVLSQFYDEAERIMKHTQEMVWDEGQTHRLQEFKALETQMLQAASNVSDPVPLDRDRYPRMPSVEFKVVRLEHEDADQYIAAPTLSKVYRQGVHYKVIDDIVNQTKDKNPSVNKHTIDIAVCGGSGTLQHFAAGYVVWKMHSPNSSSVDFRVYVLPTGKDNMLAAFLDHFDFRYSKSVYAPLTNRTPILPREPRAAELSHKSVSPPVVMRNVLDGYFVDAQQVCNVNIWRCECLTYEVQTIQNNDPNAGSQLRAGRVRQYLTIPFCQQAEFGVITTAKYKQKNDPSFANMPISDIISSKAFKYTPIKLKLSYLPMDSKGIPSVNQQETGTWSYHTLTIKNVSRFGEKGPIAAPHLPALEISALDDRKKKSKYREVDMLESYHSSFAKIESVNYENLFVMLDGEVYGPFHNIQIQPFWVDTNRTQQHKLPVQTYLPFTENFF